jgi:transposase
MLAIVDPGNGCRRTTRCGGSRKWPTHAALDRLSPAFDRMYARVGRASVPPERLLKASLLIALYSVRRKRAFCEELAYNLPWRWFLDMDLMERSFDATVFTKNRQHLLAHDVGRPLFDEVVWAADGEGLLSDVHSA